MKSLPSRHRRLDDALAALPLEEPMLLTELDGFLTGILVSPEPIPPDEWMQAVWGTDDGGLPPFEDPLDVRWFADAVTARYREIARDLARGKLRPIFDVDDRSGDILWEAWIDGFAEAMAVRPQPWAALLDGVDGDAGEAASRLSALIAVARDESELDSVRINALHDHAPVDLTDAVLRLHAARPRVGGEPSPMIGPISVKVGRNDPCGCGSGKKLKRCCG